MQRLPGLLNEVHRFIEDHRLRFALLGSSARKLRSAGVNLLAGRAVRREMFPLTPEVLGTQFDLDRTLQFGALPLVLDAADPDDVLPEAGRLFEGWVHTVLSAYVAERGLADDVAHWAPAEFRTEVDFVLRRGSAFCAIEVKDHAVRVVRWCQVSGACADR